MALRLRLLRRKGVEAGDGVRLFGTVRVFAAAGSTISLGSGVVLSASPRHNSLEARGPVILRTINPGARICVGNDTGMTSATISAAREVVIGKRVLIGAGVMITDSDHHVVRPLSGELRRYLGIPRADALDRVTIADDVFIGARSIVLKGVTIGEGSVIGAGSVVTRSIPSRSIAAGNPCRVIGPIDR